MKLAWPVGIGVSLMLLAPSPSAAQDDDGEWEGRIQYTAYIGHTSAETTTRERTLRRVGGPVISMSRSEVAQHLDTDGKLAIRIWMSGGHTTVSVTGSTSWLREDDTQQTDEKGRTTCAGEQSWFFSDTAFRDDDAGASVSMDDSNRFTISSNGTGRADASAEVLDHAGDCRGFLHYKIPTQSKRLDQPWSVSLSGVSKSRNAITLNYKTDAIPHGADGKSAAPWFYEVFEQFIPPLTERISDSGVSAFTYEEVKVDLKRKNAHGFWTGTFRADCQDTGSTASHTQPMTGETVGTSTYTRTAAEKFSVDINMPADGSAPTAQTVYHSTLRIVEAERARIRCGVLGYMNTDPGWKPYIADEDSAMTVDASGKAVPTIKVERRTADDRRTDVSIDMTISVPPVEGLQNTTLKKSFNGGCGGEPTASNSDVDDDALSPPFYWFRGVNNATSDTVSGSYTDTWKKTDKFAAGHNATCTYSWRFKYVTQEQGR